MGLMRKRQERELISLTNELDDRLSGSKVESSSQRFPKSALLDRRGPIVAYAVS